jgi:hypothetical protein
MATGPAVMPLNSFKLGSLLGTELLPLQPK